MSPLPDQPLERWILQSHTAAQTPQQHPQSAEHQAGKQQIGTEVVARLQQQPHRRDRGNKAVNDQHQRPGVLRIVVDQLRQQFRTDREPRSQCQAEEDQRHEDQRTGAKCQPATTQRYTKDNRQKNVQHRSPGDRPAIRWMIRRDRRETRRCHVEKHDQHIHQRQPDEDQQATVGQRTEVEATDFGDRTPAVTQTHHECRVVVHAADQDRTDENPGQRRPPAEERSGQDRSDDRPRTGDRTEMMPEQHRRRCGDVIEAVVHRVCRRRPAVVDLELSRKVGSKEAIRQ